MSVFKPAGFFLRDLRTGVFGRRFLSEGAGEEPSGIGFMQIGTTFQVGGS